MPCGRETGANRLYSRLDAISKPPRGPDDSETEPRAPVFTGPHWALFFDGSSRKQGAGAGVLLLTPHGNQFKYMVHLYFKATNNMTEYSLIAGGSTAPHERRLPAHRQASQGRLLLQ
jgi:hypothetical protein